MAGPIPEPPPVTTATLPLRSGSSTSGSRLRVGGALVQEQPPGAVLPPPHLQAGGGGVAAVRVGGVGLDVDLIVALDHCDVAVEQDLGLTAADRPRRPLDRHDDVGLFAVAQA